MCQQAGHLPIKLDGTLMTGKVGDTISVEEATIASEWVALNLLSTLKAELGDLDRIKKVVKLVVGTFPASHNGVWFTIV